MIELTARLLEPFAFRGKARLLHSVCPHQGEHSTRLFGFDITLDLGDYIQRSMFLRTFEPHETSLFAARLRPGMVVVDVGANVGYYSLLAASLVGPDGIVYAFEPSPMVFDRLSTTVLRNSIAQISVLNTGVGESSGSIDLYVPLTEGNHTPTMVPNDGGQAVSVAITTLDEFFAERGSARIDLLKIDVEGFEPDVIRGADGLLRSGRIAAILCEFNDHWLGRRGTSSDDLYAMIRGYGFQECGIQYQAGVELQNLMFEMR